MIEVSQNSSHSSQTSERVLKALKEARSQLAAVEQNRSEKIAIIGMAGRFPGADNLEEFWDLLEQGKSGIRMLSDEELLAAGISSDTFEQPNYVRAYASFSDPTGFDAPFFGYAPREAELIDPQHRVFLECAWSALENAGYDSQQYEGRIGVYGGAALNSYIVNLHSHPEIRDSISPVQAVVSNVMGLMPTRVSYQLDLKGPSCGIQTGCSTALVAIHTACQSLLKQECNVALAGGVTINNATPAGYFYQTESIASPDGVCRAFDANGQGTVFGNGVGIVVLKRLREAQADGDYIYAVIKGSAVNNDGADKVNLIAPSVSGQAAVIREAIAQANIDPNTISYIEGHGTATPMGDPIEVAALNKAFSTLQSAPQTQRSTCALGSVKTNLGHLDAAAGVAGLIKTVLALQHKTIPASLNYEQANPKIDFQNGPFVVSQQRTDWPKGETPRRTGVSSFGMGGTNAHAIVEEAPERLADPAVEVSSLQLIMLSAKTPTALNKSAQNLADYLQRHPEIPLADVAYTLQVGRRSFAHRWFCLCQTTGDAIAQLQQTNGGLIEATSSSEKSVVFMFSGQGSQHIGMAKGLYETEPVFKRSFDQCSEILAREDIDLFKVVYPLAQTGETILQEDFPLYSTCYAQPAIFAVEYALCQLWLSWGIRPQALIGHSIGEYVAACVAGVFSLESAIALVAQRGQLMQRCEPGSMLSVLQAAETLQPLLPPNAEIAAINGPQNCVVSGPTAVIETVQQQLERQNIPCRLLSTSHAFHSAMMDAALGDFAEALTHITLSPPSIDIISNVTGTWLEDDEATNPDYWVRQLRATVQFSQGISEVLTLPNPILLEVGPGHTLTKLAQQHLSTEREGLQDESDTPQEWLRDRIPVIQSLPHPKTTEADIHTFMTALGNLWKAGA
ncbi:MAG: type I polyketide synthase, partial [Phormidesmis sp.]